MAGGFRLWGLEQTVCIADGLCKFLNASVFIVSCGLLERKSQNLYLFLARECVKLTAAV